LKKLQLRYRALKNEFAGVESQKKEILELLNFQQISVTNIGTNIQTLISDEFEQSNNSLLEANKGTERRQSMRFNLQKVLGLAERLACFTLRNQARECDYIVVNSKTVFADNKTMLESILNAKNQKLTLLLQEHSLLKMPIGGLDKILRGVILQASKAADRDTTLNLSCDVYEDNFNFSVTAWGEGIGEQDEKNIELSVLTNPRFHYAKRAEDSEGDLNLASIFRLVGQFGGSVKLVSALRYSTSIFISLPRAPNSAVSDLANTRAYGLKPEHRSKNELLLATYQDQKSSKVDKPKILIIDQNDASQMHFHRALQNTYQCYACTSALESMKLIHNLQPAIIILDHTLIDIEPLELIKLIRCNPQTENIPILVCSGLALQSFRLSALRLGATCIVEKPIMQTELQLTVAGLLEQQELVAEQVGEKLSEYHSQQLDVPEPTKFDSEKDKSFIERFNEMMEENFSNENFTREIAAAHMNVCLRTLNRRLSEYYSHNFKEHLKKYRLEQAKSLLTKGYTINEASFEVGFNSASYFSTCFKAEYGFAPSRLVAQCA
jgi:AraC-like DNA-binding protein/CheY-like chemotaxis protein